MNSVTPVRTRIGDVAVLALLTVNGALLGAFSLAFTPMYVAGFPAPMGILFAVSILPWLVTRAGEIDARPAVAAAPLAAWFLAVVVLGLGGPGGDVMLPVLWQSGVLLLGGIVAGLWALREVTDRGDR